MNKISFLGVHKAIKEKDGWSYMEKINVLVWLMFEPL